MREAPSSIVVNMVHAPQAAVDEAGCRHTIVEDGPSTPSPDLLKLTASRGVIIKVYDVEALAFAICDERTTTIGTVLNMLVSSRLISLRQN
ncbi:hypothetical protein N7466_006036 [Penicillium verhagenii]|uniref:uncharacterized protein n=1 Tax=Penicillium verhagenii TaxID=1562060 RepID=UPI002544FA20|nr:uncharacterized protein N7466_006036 [Penicillium verhagenii]KAJ5930543.1 hypothetical protein N7466_006036 [Penicillium verhagenii]